jgi:hypothetical protein
MSRQDKVSPLRMPSRCQVSAHSICQPSTRHNVSYAVRVAAAQNHKHGAREEAAGSQPSRSMDRMGGTARSQQQRQMHGLTGCRPRDPIYPGLALTPLWGKGGGTWRARGSVERKIGWKVQWTVPPGVFQTLWIHVVLFSMQNRTFEPIWWP